MADGEKGTRLSLISDVSDKPGTGNGNGNGKKGMIGNVS